MNDKLQRAFLYLAYALPLLLIIGRAPADIVLGLVGLGFLVQSALTKNFKWLCKPWIRIALFTWIYLIFDAMLAVYDVKIALHRSIEWIRFPLFAAAFAFWLLPQDPDFKILRRFLPVLLILVAFDALLQFVIGHDIFGFQRSPYMGRLTGPFGDNVVVGLFLLRLVFPVTGLLFAHVFRNYFQHRYFILPLVFALIIGTTILLSGERMAFILFVFCSGLFFLGARSLRRLIFAGGSLFLVAAIISVMLSPELHNRFVTFTKPAVENFDGSSYGAIFHNAIITWKTSPITGVGPKNFFAACSTLGIKGGFRDEATWDSKFSCARHPHNPYMEWLTETGVIGLGFFLAMIAIWASVIRRNLQQTDMAKYYIALGFAVGMVPFLWPFMAVTSFFINWSAILFWWVLGLNMSLANAPCSDPVVRTAESITAS